MVHKSLVSIALMALILGCASDSDSDVKPSEGDASVAQDAGSVPDAARQTTDSDMPNDGSVMQMDGQMVTDAVVEPLEPISNSDAPEALKNAVCSFSERCDLLELFELVINESCGDFVQRQFEDGTLASLESALESGEVIYNG